MSLTDEVKYNQVLFAAFRQNSLNNFPNNCTDSSCEQQDC